MTRLIALTLIVIGALAQAQTITWTNGHQYSIVTMPEGATWETAASDAASRGGKLATITSHEENNFIFQLIDGLDASGLPSPSENAHWVSQSGAWLFGPWIGLTQQEGAMEPAGGWGWSAEEPFDELLFHAWNRNITYEPNNSPANENRAHYHTRENEPKKATWNDLQGSWVIRPNCYVLEIENTPGRFVTGTVQPNGGKMPAFVDIQFRSIVDQTLIGGNVRVAVSAGGDFSVVAPGYGTYQITTHPKGYLRRTVSVDTTLANAAGTVLSLVPGDILASNVIDIADYSKLALHFDRAFGNPWWLVGDADGITDADCDLNGDLIVDIADYSLLALNFDRSGDL